jgi:glycine cleavage system H protein
MFPWSPEFVWDAGHLAFFGAFYSVLAAIAAVLGLGLRRAVADARAGRAHRIAWHAAFEELPARDRACRHQLTGEAPGRVCDNAFDCRRCAAHPSFEALRATHASAVPATGPAGLHLPGDRLYHRGHAFVRPEPDGTVTVGLDDLARRLVGEAEVVERPRPGMCLEEDAPALRLRAQGREVRVLSPVRGVVIGTSGEGAAVTVRVDPEGPLDTRHLLDGDEVGAWAMREIERLQALLGPRELGPALADGGELLPDLGAVIPRERVDGVLGEMFLDL